MTAAPSDSDRLTRFLLPHAGVRGVRVHLHESWARIRGNAAGNPTAATGLLGEAVAASALFTAHAKVDGRLSIQLRGSAALRSLFAECTAAGTLRGIVRLAEDADTLPEGLRAAAGSATLAITIENPGGGTREPVRYQSLVAVETDSLATAFEGHFRQSEQLPTRLLLAAGEDAVAGLMLQKLPGDAGDADGWTRAGALFETLAADELLAWSGDTLLHRLFHEEAPQAMGERELRFGCSCSRERVAGMLQALGQEEAGAAAATGMARIVCEFCGQAYGFDRAEIDALFTAPAASSMEAPGRLQ